ncbi:hypothetical protein [Methanoculleus sp.]|uniref:hypothetical protein n=1 Tax=Methanoculleus sp. TaxID=90427 RepID=UPI002608F975|nr:hypothetical protein [Methanoculleus sp.]MDI6867296.1 hypothetical protein [Methanoculleus sp.]
MEPALRSEILILFLSFLIGSTAGWWVRIHCSGATPAVAVTLAGTVAAYLIITGILRANRHRRDTP